jgi:hypothetical protein
MHKILSFLLIFQLLACQSEPILTPEHLANLKVGDKVKEAALLAFTKTYTSNSPIKRRPPVFDTIGSYEIVDIPNEATKKSLVYLFTEDPPFSVERDNETYYLKRRISIQHVQVFEHQQKDDWYFEIQIFEKRPNELQMRLQISQSEYRSHIYFLTPQANRIWKVIAKDGNGRYSGVISRKIFDSIHKIRYD